MNPALQVKEWMIVENGFKPKWNRASESIFSIGNGKMGQRANFEEKYSGDSLQGNYLAGIYYPDKTRVGWWKNGYPEYFAKVINAANWIGINVWINNQELDLAICKVRHFKRTLNMKEGTLKRSFVAELPEGEKVAVESLRFLSLVEPEAGVIRYAVKALNFSGEILFNPYLDLNVRNEDANYNEQFWEEAGRKVSGKEGFLHGKTKKLNFHVCTGTTFELKKNDKILSLSPHTEEKNKFIGFSVPVRINENDEVCVTKFAVNLTSLDHEVKNMITDAEKVLHKIRQTGFSKLQSEHSEAWKQKWEESDIYIEGDIAAQQGIRFNIFQLNQTYTGKDARLNIGPKGFTGEKYGGSTYWDTEAFVLPFYLCTTGPKAGRNLLLYRYKHLPKAIENARKLGFNDGAALFPMVTMNGEECHNEWEITFEEIHRNGAIAYAIYNYIRHTGDESYMITHGLEVLIGISRFWSQRVNWSPEKNKYVILGVTGPNEYENNVNNNWYTNTIAVWTLKYTLNNLYQQKKESSEQYRNLVEKLNFREKKETEKWQEIIDNMYFPYHTKEKVFLQQDGYLDKEPLVVADINPEERPLNQHWSWDRILRSPFIKQADVLQGIYFFEEKFDTDTIKRNFNYYEPRTVHESSLSACIHSVLASKTGDIEKAYDLYLRTARLDLDDYNHEVSEGLHITSMAGTWLSIVEGFGGMKIQNNTLTFKPLIPGQWKSYSFYTRFRENLLNVRVDKKTIKVFNLTGPELKIIINQKKYLVGDHESLVVPKSKDK